MKNPNLLILGNGGAAANAIEGARNAGYKGKITLVSDVEGPSFNPMLAPYYLKGLIPWEACFPFGRDLYKRHDVTCHFGSAVESLDAENQRVRLESGRRIPYDQCLIATGASPVVPPIPGLKTSSRALPLRTAASARRMEKPAASAGKVVVLGASLVGLKVAEIMKKRGAEVILLDVVEQVLPRGAHPETAALLKTYLEKKGIDVRLGCTLEGLESHRKKAVCHFSEHIVEEADFIAVCTGVRPNMDFIDASRIQTAQAVLVDNDMRTNRPGVFAAGDVSQGMNLLTGRREWLGTWGNACAQGRTAGCNMAGLKTQHAGMIPQNISPFFDWTYAQLGDVTLEGEDIQTLSAGNPFDGPFYLMTFRADRLVGANLINCTQDTGPLRQAIVNRANFGDFIEAVRKNPTVQKFETLLPGTVSVLLPQCAQRRGAGGHSPVCELHC